jgi:DegV family protein with EDD domain
MNLSTGIGLQVLFAAELAQSGCSLDELEDILKEYRLRVRASFVVDTLTYLQRGGRCSAVTALMGNALKLKPRIAVTDGKMGVSKKYRGNQKKTVTDYVKDMEEELLERINASGIGPGGLGGTTTALAVNINTYPTHIAGLPVAINICCHVNRHAVRVL